MNKFYTTNSTKCQISTGLTACSVKGNSCENSNPVGNRVEAWQINFKNFQISSKIKWRMSIFKATHVAKKKLG